MARAVNKGEMDAIIGKRRKPEVNRDAPLLGLCVFVESSRWAVLTKDTTERGLPGVDVTQHAHINVIRKFSARHELQIITCNKWNWYFSILCTKDEGALLGEK